MRLTRYMVAPALLALSSLAMAGNFDGASLKLDAVANSSQTTLKDYSPDGKVSDINTVGRISLNYSQAIDTFNLAGGVFAVLGTSKSGSLRSFSDDTGGTWSDSFKLKNVMGVSIEPGYNLNDSTLLYTKFSYVRATGTNTYDYTNADVPEDAGSAKRTHNGFGFGVGAKVKLSGNLYGTIEVEQYNFNSKSYYSDVSETYKPRMLMGSVGIGYQF